MFDNRDASCVLSMAGMLKCKLFSLLKFHAAISVAIGEFSLPAAACHKERNSGVASGMGFPSKMLPWEISSLSRGGCI